MFCRIVAIYLDTDFIIFTSTVYVCISIILLCQPDLDYYYSSIVLLLMYNVFQSSDLRQRRCLTLLITLAREVLSALCGKLASAESSPQLRFPDFQLACWKD